MSYKIRTTVPNGQKEYIRTINGGWSTAIQGQPTRANADVLANCVGYACGRFGEIINEINKTIGLRYSALNCNAENFIERAISLGLSVVKEPVAGGIMVWRGGATLSAHDGVGHVEIVERVNNANQVYTSASHWQGVAFQNVTRNKGANGNWGMSSHYTYRGCIVNPAVRSNPTVTTPPTPMPLFRVGRHKLTTAVNVRVGAGTNQRQKTVRELTLSGRASATSANLNALATLRGGTVIDLLEVRQIGNDWWGRIPSGWIALRHNNQSFVTRL